MRFCRGVRKIKLAVLFLIVRMWLTIMLAKRHRDARTNWFHGYIFGCEWQLYFLRVDLTFYSLDHFLQPKDKNTQHKLKISHLIVYNFSSLIIILYFQSDIHTHLEAKEPRFSSIWQSWLEKVNLMPPPSPDPPDRPQSQTPLRGTIRRDRGSLSQLI